MYDISDLKVGSVFELEGEPYIILESQHSKMGRAGAVLRTRIKGLVSGVTVSKTFRSSDKFTPVIIERKKFQFLYFEGEDFLFMDLSTYEQVTLGKTFVGSAKNYLQEGESYQLEMFQGKPIAIDLPVKMNFEVIQAEKGLKGDTASKTTKPVTIETGLKVNVPLFISQGDRIVVDTRDGSYVEREK